MFWRLNESGFEILSPIIVALGRHEEQRLIAHYLHRLRADANDQYAAIGLLLSLLWSGRDDDAVPVLHALHQRWTLGGVDPWAALEALIYLLHRHGQQDRIRQLARMSEDILREYGEAVDDITELLHAFYLRSDPYRLFELLREGEHHGLVTRWRPGHILALRRYKAIGEIAMRASLAVLWHRFAECPGKPLAAVQLGGHANPAFMEYIGGLVDLVSDQNEISQLRKTRGVVEADLEWDEDRNGNLVPTDTALTFALCRWEAGGGEPLLSLTADHAARGLAVLRAMGLPEGARFACLHVRQSGFHQDDGYETACHLRNADIDAYLRAIEAMRTRGYWVIRLGDTTMPRLPRLDGVVDYPFTAFKSDWMDLFLCAAATLFVGTASGMFVPATMFGTPVVLTNQTPLSQRSFSSRDIVIPKLYRRTSDGSLLSFAESMAAPMKDSKMGADIRAAGCEPRDNTPEEITAAIEEMMDRIEGKTDHAAGPDTAALRTLFDRVTRHDIGVPVPMIGAHFIDEHRALLGTGLARERETVTPSTAPTLPAPR